MSYKKRKVFDDLKKSLLIDLYNKQRGISVFDMIHKLKYCGCGLLTPSLVERMKCIDEHSFMIGRKELFYLSRRR